MITTHCAICNKKEKLVLLFKGNVDLKKVNAKTFSARRIPDRLHYRMVKCLRCGLIFSNPILTDTNIKSLYQKSDFTYKFESEYLKKSYWYYLKRIASKNKSNLNYLDVGCGNGFMLEEAYLNGINNVWGIEPGRPSVLKAKDIIRKKIKIGVLKEGLFPNNSFDMISCFQTLDHIPNPNAFLKIVYSLLKKKGKIIFIVHNTDGLSVKLFGERSPIFDIEHIYLFNKATLKNIFKQNGYNFIEVFDVRNTYPLRYWFRMIPIPKTMKKWILKILNYSKIGNVIVSLNAGNIGIVASK